MEGLEIRDREYKREDSGLIVYNGKAVLAGKVLEDCRIEVAGGKIVDISRGRLNGSREKASGRAVVDARGGWIVPGFVDIHVHGGGGADFMDATGAALRTIVGTHLRHGTTTMLTTSMSAHHADILEAAKNLRFSGIAGGEDDVILGCHLEGPFINPAHRGAHNPGCIRKPDEEELKEIYAELGPLFKLATVAPEVEGGERTVSWLLDKGVVAALGHSDCTYDLARQMFDSGLNHITHCFNAMRGYHHREPGAVGAALIDERVVVQLIADGIHVHPGTMELMYKLKGPEGIALITDGMRAVGMAPGEYELGGMKVRVCGDEARLVEGGALAGSVLTMDRAFGNAIGFMGISPCDAARMTSLVPAKVLGEDHRIGSLSVGKQADMAILDDSYNTTCTIKNGKIVWRN